MYINRKVLCIYILLTYETWGKLVACYFCYSDYIEKFNFNTTSTSNKATKQIQAHNMNRIRLDKINVL